MGELFLHILETSLHGSVVILAVMLLRLLLKKTPKSVFCLLWLLAGLGLMLPLEIESSFSLQPRLEPMELDQTVVIQVPVDIPASAPTVHATGTEEPETVKPETEKTAGEEMVPAIDNWESTGFLYGVTDGEIRPLHYGDIGACLWVVGIAVLSCASLLSYRNLKRRVREAVLVEDGCWECAGLDTAFILGYVKPRIYLPTGLSDRERKFVLDHERSHLAKGDHWAKLMAFAVLTVHWFNPLVWAAYVLLCRDIEMACDQRVIRNMELPERKAYSAALLSCSSNRSHFTACPVAFGEGSMRHRILSVLMYRKPGFWISLLGVAAIIFVAVCFLTSPSQEIETINAPALTYTQSGITHREIEPYGSAVSFDEVTMDWESEWAVYHFDTAISEEERNACVYCSDAILSRLDLDAKPDILIMDGYEGAWTDGSWYYLGADDVSSAAYGAKLITLACGGYANYGAAYGYAEYIAVQEGWRDARSYRVSLTDSDARDMNWLCFREEFVSGEEIESNKDAACVFVLDCIADNGESAFLRLLKQSGDVAAAAVFKEALSDWYAGHGLAYEPSEILYAIGGEVYDYLVKCRYGTFYLPEDWGSRRRSELVEDETYLHQDYSEVKFCFETNAAQMKAVQEFFGMDRDTSDLEILFMSGLGNTQPYSKLIQLSALDYLNSSYIKYITFVPMMLRMHDGSYYEWITAGMPEYIAQMVPNIYGDATHVYAAENDDGVFSDLEGEWFRCWWQITEGETDPDVLWRTRWDFIAYYFDETSEGEGGMIMSFTAYLIDELGFDTMFDFSYKTGEEAPEIDVAAYRIEWEAWLEETYGMYPKYEG